MTTPPPTETAAATDSLSVTDNRTGKTYALPIKDGAIRAADLRQIKTGPEDFGLMAYDPAFLNTASCKSRITFIDGDKGILEYRGYPIDELAEKSTHLEVAYLLLHGELPNAKQLSQWQHDITHHTLVHANMGRLIEAFRSDAHPMGVVQAAAAALSTYYPDARDIKDPANRALQIRRLIAKMPTIGAMAYRHGKGLPFVMPNNELSYAGNFLAMLFRMTEAKYVPNPVIERALDVLFILHADHEQNCSTSTVRLAGSSQANPYSAIAAGISALWGPAHGGANEAVLQMLEQIGTPENIPRFIARAKDKNDTFRLMGFGHRVYKNYDPRARIIRTMTHKVLKQLGKSDPMLDVAMRLEEIALKDPYFIEKKLYPNVDFYSGIIYKALGIPTSMFTVMFAIGRTVGWCAHWREMITDADGRIGRPRQLYTGPARREYTEIGKR